jgi:hypothetical protein
VGVRRYIITTRLGGDYRWRPIDGVKSDKAAIVRGQEIADEMAADSEDKELWAQGALTIKSPDGEVIWYTLTEG